MKTPLFFLLIGLLGALGGCNQDGPAIKKDQETARKDLDNVRKDLDKVKKDLESLRLNLELVRHEVETVRQGADAAPKPKGQIGPNVFLKIEDGQRRVHINAQVCLRQGQLEHFLTRTKTKEHEAILAADVDARHIHAALLAAGAEQGQPVKFDPKYVPAKGGRVKVLVQYQDQGQLVTLPAQKWIRHIKTRKEMEHQWIFVGSHFFEDPDDPKKKLYAANNGDLICISNFDTAMLDLPITSTRYNEELMFEAFTERIPPEKTPVLVILEPLRK